MTGGVASRLIVTDSVDVPPSLVATHVKTVPVVSVEIVVGAQPVCDVIADSASLTDQLTVTLLVYQPLVPRVPTTVRAITGRVPSSALTVMETVPCAVANPSLNV